MQQDQQENAMRLIVAKCWADESFKQRLLSDTTATLKAEGVELPEGLNLVAHENTPDTVHIVIEAKPTELTDDILDAIIGGAGMPKGWCEPGALYTQFLKNYFRMLQEQRLNNQPHTINRETEHSKYSI